MPGSINPPGSDGPSLPDANNDPWISPDGTAIDAVAIGVYRMDGDDEIWPMPSLECVDVTWHEGAKPKTARIAYKFGDGNPDSPQWIEEALSTEILLAETVQPGDRLLVLATRPDGTSQWIFDGVAVRFAAILDEDDEEVVLECVGIEWRLWETPVGGQILRNGGSPSDAGTTGEPNHCLTDLPAVFNYRGQPNCSPEDADFTFGDGSNHEREAPIFMDPSIVRDPDIRRFWDLASTACHLIYANNDEKYVSSPDESDLQALLVGREPLDADPDATDPDATPPPPFDPTDPSTYNSVPVIVPATPISNRPWPPTLEGLIGDKGFALAFRLETDGDGDPDVPPSTRLDVYLNQGEDQVDVWLQPQGSPLDLSLTNLGACTLTRDLADAPNRWVVEGAPVRHQGAFILECGFPDPAPAVDAYDAYSLNAPGFASVRDAYRLYHFNETGDGVYNPGSPEARLEAPSLDAILGKPVVPDGASSGSPALPQYAQRRRPPLGELASLDPSGKPYKAMLSYSTDYAGETPGQWDGTGTWQAIQGGYDLLNDRLGIYVNVQNPNHWEIGDGASGSPKILKAIASQAHPDAINPSFWLKLECVIEADAAVKGVADRRKTSPLPRTITRKVDARDRYVKQVIDAPSEFNPEPSSPPIVARDDTDAATAEAISLRDATDAGLLEGPIEIPWFTTLMDIGMRVRKINGRELGFRTDGGGESDTPVLPRITTIHWHLRGDQSTSLHISDGQLLRSHRRAAISGRTAQRPRGRGTRTQPFRSPGLL